LLPWCFRETIKLRSAKRMVGKATHFQVFRKKEFPPMRLDTCLRRAALYPAELRVPVERGL
jgi:hypothetical protein